MQREEIIAITNDFLKEEIEVDEAAINENATFKDDLGIDSLDFVDIVVIVEKKFGFKIKAEEMANVTTLGGFYDYIEQKVNNPQA
jgi:acyl carrier protein